MGKIIAVGATALVAITGIKEKELNIPDLFRFLFGFSRAGRNNANGFAFKYAGFCVGNFGTSNAAKIDGLCHTFAAVST